MGHSGGQLKSRSCILYRCNADAEVEQLLREWGDFDRIQSIAKRSKRIGLLFSSFQRTARFGSDRPLQFEVIDDVERNGYCFTDGCGNISAALARRLARDNGIDFRGEHHVPSVFQVSYQMRGSHKEYIKRCLLSPPMIFSRRPR